MHIMRSCLLAGLGGFIGTVGRYLVGLIPIRPTNGFPAATLFINVAGAFAIGLLAGWASRNNSPGADALLFLKVGVCGGFTTFSAFSLETAALLQNGAGGAGLLYAGLSVVLCVAAAFGGQLLLR